jgi:HlyD family secretion protein
MKLILYLNRGVLIMSGNKKTILVGITVALLAICIFYLLPYFTPEPLPSGIASGNGRIEATEYDISTRFAGRVSTVNAKEGDMVEVGQVLAVMDTEEFSAQLREAKAVLTQALEGKNYAYAIVEQRKSELTYWSAELKRALELVKKGHISQEKVDQDRNAQQTAIAALSAAKIQVLQSEAAIEAAKARVERLDSNIADSSLTTPIRGRVLYRLTEPGEILAGGGKVLTVLELTDVYMTIYLPSGQAGKVRIGSEARLKLDALPDVVIPATVSFVAPEAQFTPKEVETRTEREKLMFRVKIKISPELLRKHIEKVKTGLPGVAFVKLDDKVQWPVELITSVPQ